MVSLSVWVCLVLTVAAEPKIVTAVGTGEAGDSGYRGPAVKARLNQPFDVALDPRATFTSPTPLTTESGRSITRHANDLHDRRQRDKRLFRRWRAGRSSPAQRAIRSCG